MLAAHDQRRAPRPRRRGRGHLAPGDDHRSRRRTASGAAVGRLDEVLLRLLLEHLSRRREQRPVAQSRVDRLVRAAERDVGAREIGALARDAGSRCMAGSRRTARSTRSGWRAASSATSLPPKLCPIHVAPEIPRSSTVSRRSARAAPRSTEAPSRSGHGRGSRRRSRGSAGRCSSASRRKRRPWPVTPCRQTTGAPAGSPHSVTFSRTRAPACRNGRLRRASRAVAASASG